MVELQSLMNSEKSQGTVLKTLLQAKESGELPGIFGRLGDLGAIAGISCIEFDLDHKSRNTYAKHGLQLIHFHSLSLRRNDAIFVECGVQLNMMLQFRLPVLGLII